jgi:hypothetical protein
MDGVFDDITGYISEAEDIPSCPKTWGWYARKNTSTGKWECAFDKNRVPDFAKPDQIVQSTTTVMSDVFKQGVMEQSKWMFAVGAVGLIALLIFGRK